jgi:hypothetical protein
VALTRLTRLTHVTPIPDPIPDPPTPPVPPYPPAPPAPPRRRRSAMTLRGRSGSSTSAASRRCRSGWPRSTAGEARRSSTSERRVPMHPRADLALERPCHANKGSCVSRCPCVGAPTPLEPPSHRPLPLAVKAPSLTSPFSLAGKAPTPRSPLFTALFSRR